jgi:hypothetical protein
MKLRSIVRFAPVLLFTLASACSAGSTDDESDDGAGGSDGAGASTASSPSASTGSDTANTTGTGFASGTSTSSGGTPSGCEGNDGDVFMLSKEYDLYRFEPDTLAVTLVGPLSCPQNGGTATPFSMSVDRSGTAWVLYNDGKLYNVSTSDASCQATNFVPDQLGFDKFGMGFVSNSAGSEDETLFIAGEFGLGSIDTSSLTVTAHGEFGFSAAAELTGNANAELFGLFYGFPPYISKLDKTNSALGAEQPLDGVDAGTGFAFAFWGGSFWVFTGSSSSKVDRYDPISKTVENKIPSLGFKVVGAGVSTCAPVVVPR